MSISRSLVFYGKIDCNLDSSDERSYSDRVILRTTRETSAVTNTEITILLEKAKRITMSSKEREQQRRSFAYGNANIENEAVTKEVIEEVANRMVREPEIDDLTSE